MRQFMTPQEIRLLVAPHLMKIAGIFKEGVKLTLIARNPMDDKGDFILTNDTKDQAAKALLREHEVEE